VVVLGDSEEFYLSTWWGFGANPPLRTVRCMKILSCIISCDGSGEDDRDLRLKRSNDLMWLLHNDGHLRGRSSIATALVFYKAMVLLSRDFARATTIHFSIVGTPKYHAAFDRSLRVALKMILGVSKSCAGVAVQLELKMVGDKAYFSVLCLSLYLRLLQAPLHTLQALAFRVAHIGRPVHPFVSLVRQLCVQFRLVPRSGLSKYEIQAWVQDAKTRVFKVASDSLFKEASKMPSLSLFCAYGNRHQEELPLYTSLPPFKGRGFVAKLRMGDLHVRDLVMKHDDSLLWCSVCSQYVTPVVSHADKSGPSMWSGIYHLLCECSDPSILYLRQEYLNSHLFPLYGNWSDKVWSMRLAYLGLFKFTTHHPLTFAAATGSFLAELLVRVGAYSFSSIE
jgi:hypothetical protein